VNSALGLPPPLCLNYSSGEIPDALDLIENSMKPLLILLILTLAPLALSRAQPASTDCTWGLNTVVVAPHCAGGNNTCGDGAACCLHEHQTLSYNQLIDVGFETGMTPRGTGSPVKKYYDYKKYLCDDYDEDSQTPTTCAWPFIGVSTDGPGGGSGANHYVWDWSLATCD